MKNLNSFITLKDLLKGRCEDFDNTPDNAIQLIRHADKRVKKSAQKNESADLKIDGKDVPSDVANLYELYIFHRDLFDMYQSEQLKGRFDGIKYWVVFLGEKGTTGRLLGVYEIMGRTPSAHAENEEVLKLRQVPEFKFLEEKVIIEWGKGTVNWYQYYYNDKDVIRIEEGLNKADGTPVFKDYSSVLLNYHQLIQVLEDPDWTQKLKALNCIYLIVDKSNGKLYVGSTYNREGIYGRWQDYAATGHGNNKKLVEKVDGQADYHIQNFQWTILETLPLNITELEAIEREALWKRKLLSLQHGYNEN